MSGGKSAIVSGRSFAVRAVERAARAELGALPVELRASTLANVAVNLASRLDAEPADREATMLAHELRLTMKELHRMAPEGGVDDVERFLGRIAAPDLGHTAN
jgi:hypothetical protein